MALIECHIFPFKTYKFTLKKHLVFIKVNYFSNPGSLTKWENTCIYFKALITFINNFERRSEKLKQLVE